MEINSKFIKITGSGETDKNLELDEEVILTVKGSVVKVEEGSNQDGSKDRIFKIKINTIE